VFTGGRVLTDAEAADAIDEYLDWYIRHLNDPRTRDCDLDNSPIGRWTREHETKVADALSAKAKRAAVTAKRRAAGRSKHVGSLP
jgi:hypothetical protein